jgi:hypothetical protein
MWGINLTGYASSNEVVFEQKDIAEDPLGKTVVHISRIATDNGMTPSHLKSGIIA